MFYKRVKTLIAPYGFVIPTDRCASQQRSQKAVGVAITRATGALRGVLWRSGLAWQVTLFLGLDCFLYYVGVSWLPTILQDAGYTGEQAGSMHGVLLLATAIPGLLLIPLIPRMKDQRALACILSLSIAAGLLGLLCAPNFAVLWILVFGFGAGGGLILALLFISLRTPNAEYAAGLSGMAQCAGYLVASLGPPTIGRIHDAAGSWVLPLTVCATLGGVMAFIGFFAGRDIELLDHRLSADGPASTGPSDAGATAAAK